MPPSRSDLRLEPISAMTYGSKHDLAEVTCPPYDSISPAALRSYESAHSHNIVRLILPRTSPGDERFTWAADELQSWLDTGVLVTDAASALYVYEQVTALGTALGLVGGVALDGPVLPHENTYPGPVADRVALMTAMRAQLEPILLTYEGDGVASDIVDAVRKTPPHVEVTAPASERHRLWRISNADQIRQVRDDLAPRKALIADGHHRFAAYRQLHAAGGPGADGLGLAMLVDAKRHPLALRGMHRSVAGLPLNAAVDRLGSVFSVTNLRADPMAALAEAGTGSAFAVGDGSSWVLATASNSAAIAEQLPTEHSRRWRSLESAVLRHVVLAGLWDVDDASERVAYHHDSADATARAEATDGVVVLVRSPDLGDVLGLATDDERMPPKSTSFGPKPLMGLVMRQVP